MKKLVVTFFAIIIGTVLFAQTSIEKEFKNFLNSRIESDGSYYFNSLCIIDTVFTEDKETGEFTQVAQKTNLKVTKNRNFKITTNGLKVSAPFDYKLYNGSGEELGSRPYIIEFNSENNFEISGITGDQNFTWEKIGECWILTKY